MENESAEFPSRRLLLMPWRWRWWTLGLTMAAGFLITYGLSYAALVDQTFHMAAFGPDDRLADAIPSVCYPQTQALPPEMREAMKMLFAPVHWLDRLVRPNYLGRQSLHVIID
jgi:hypothetical protein